MNDGNGNSGDRDLARAATQGNAIARGEINRRVHPLILARIEQLCKKYCHDLRFNHICTLDRAWGLTTSNAPLCEWGNGGYEWTLQDLTKASRLLRFKGDGGASLEAYWGTILRSGPFQQRWQAWRFGGRQRAPSYLQDLDADAPRLFYLMRKGQDVALMAQALKRPEIEVADLARRLVIALTMHKALHLLQADHEVSLTGLVVAADTAAADSKPPQTDLPSLDTPPEDMEMFLLLQKGWADLDPVEQFVLEAMIIEQQDALAVLAALEAEGHTLAAPGKDRGRNPRLAAGAAEKRQQLYYFKRRALAKLANLAGIAD